MSASTGKAPASTAGPSKPKPLDDEMLDTDSEVEEPTVSIKSFHNLQQQTRAQAQQIASLMELINQMTAQHAAP